MVNLVSSLVPNKRILFGLILGLIMLGMSRAIPFLYNYQFSYINPFLYINRGYLFHFQDLLIDTPLRFIAKLFSVEYQDYFLIGGPCLSPWYPSRLGCLLVFAFYFAVGFLVSWGVGRLKTASVYRLRNIG